MTAKRVIDMSIAAIGLVLTLPLMLLIALILRLTMGFPVLFKQTRPGLDGRPFAMCKFRTMNGAVDEHGRLLPDGQRLSSFGGFLRNTSLDELPELLNVLKGDMSLVGPRPLLMAYLERYTPEQARRHEVKPGITGWAQVNGRNAIDWEEKFRLDIWYIENRSFRLDLKILWQTAINVLQQKGIRAAEHATMPEFTGTRSEGMLPLEKKN